MKHSYRNKIKVLLYSLLITGSSLAAIFPLQGISLNPLKDHNKVSYSLPDSLTKAQPPKPDTIYQLIIQKADQLFLDKKYELCLVELEKAQKMRPQEQTIKDRINKVKGLIADRQRKLPEYQKYLASGDVYFNAGDYLNAKASYQMAIDIMPDEPQAKDKLKKTMDLLRAQKAQNILYDVAVASADKLFQAKEYDKARVEYENASRMLSSEKYPKDRINEIIKIQVDLQMKEDGYARAIANGDRLYVSLKYRQALPEYENASKLKPEESYPKEKIARLKVILDSLQAIDDEYIKAIASGDQLFSAKSFTDSRKSYVQASKLKPDQIYPKNRIMEIDRILASSKQLEDEFQHHVALADSFYIGKQYIKARDHYYIASTLKPGDPYPKEMLTKTSGYLNAQETASKERDEQYLNLIAEADKLFASQSYPEAKTEFIKASVLKPEESYPLQKINEIDGIIASIEQMKSLESQYSALILKADQLLAEKSYEQAKAAYLNSSGLKPAESYPRIKVSEVDGILAELAKQKALDERYQNLITMADKLLMEQSLENAKTTYQQALTLKPEQEYPAGKIKEIDIALQLLADQKALDERYSGLIEIADQHFQSGAYAEARQKYLEASQSKPAEQYPHVKVEEIDSITNAIARQQILDRQFTEVFTNGEKQFAAKAYHDARNSFLAAAAIRHNDEKVKARLLQTETALQEIADRKARDEQYNLHIADAEKLLNEKMYVQAKDAFLNASTIKPAEEYPKSKVKEIDIILAEQARQKAFEEQYSALISKADSQFDAREYEQAKNSYQQALKKKPTDLYPAERLNAIEEILTAIAAQKARDDQFTRLIYQGDAQFTEKKYDLAQGTYMKALELKPEDEYTKDKIAEIKIILAELKAQEEAYRAAIAKGDELFSANAYEDARQEYQNALLIRPGERYPRQRIDEANRLLAELKGKQQTYDNLLITANDLFFKKEYMQAKESYQQALTLFPGEEIPQSRIIRINSILDSLYRANKALYDQAIGDGDRFFNAYEFDKAIDSYEAAHVYLPMERYPMEMISKIRKTISENAIADVLKNTVTIPSWDDRKFTFSPVNMAARKNNFVYLKVRNLSEKPINVLMRYGSGTQPSGGIVIRNLAPDGKTHERLVSVKEQDAWYRNDNDWISLNPQGGDIEVFFIQVSRSRIE